MLRKILRVILQPLGLLLSKLFFKLTISGEEHVPAGGPLIVISNHFTWWEAPLLMIHLPFTTSFIAAKELERFWWYRFFAYVYELIPIWRGQVDRQAIQMASKRLEAGQVVGIFPEGGVDPDLQEAIANGEMIMQTGGHIVRQKPELIRSRPGAAFLAVRSQAPILPVAFLGTENTAVNLRKFRRTPVRMIIGPVFGPLQMPDNLRGTARRGALNELGDVMMYHLAAVMPPENQGLYRIEPVAEQP